MSKDMLGSVVRAAVGVPQDRLETLAKIASRIAQDAPGCGEWHNHLASLIQNGLPHAAPVLQSTFTRNEHGHVVITITGAEIQGVQEIERLGRGGYRIGDYAKQCFTSTAKDGYDKCHRLVADQTYRIALVPGRELKRDADQTTANLRMLGEKYGYGKPLAGIIPRIRETVSDKLMEDMRAYYIAALHEPINDSSGDPRIFLAHRGLAGRSVDTCLDRPGRRWSDDGLFAFSVAAS